MRGKLALQHIDFCDTETKIIAPKAGKGRSSLLLGNRNKKIIARYYYHNAIKNKPYTAAIAMLAYEFDLNDRTLATILKKETAAIVDMRKRKPTISSFKRQYPFLQW